LLAVEVERDARRPYHIQLPLVVGSSWCPP
jgi:hypothetical protein